MEHDIVKRKFHFRGAPYYAACLNVPESIQHPSWWSHVDEHDVRMRDWYIQHGDIVHDLGAAYGSYALPALARGAALVTAFSPQASPGLGMSEADFLRMSLEMNDFKLYEDLLPIYEKPGQAVYISENGLYREGVAYLNVDTQETWSSLEEAKNSNVDVSSDNILKVGTFDKYCEEHMLRTIMKENPIANHWLKLDVEGAEDMVLLGAQSYIREFHPIIQVENHSFKIPNIVFRVAQALGRITDSHDDYRMIHNYPYHSVSHSIWLHRSYEWLEGIGPVRKEFL